MLKTSKCACREATKAISNISSFQRVKTSYGKLATTVQ